MKVKKKILWLKMGSKAVVSKFDKFMFEQGYTRCHFDHCVYLKKKNDDNYIIFLLYVYDILVAGYNMWEINVLKIKLGN